jgi:hypothetical protein
LSVAIPKKFYKFRSLGDETSLHRVKEMLQTGKIYCSKYWELNDPMEGVYRSLEQPSQFAADLRCEKINTLIGCLSSKKALTEPLMWGHYANGFKGVAVEFTHSNQKAGVDGAFQFEKMDYVAKPKGVKSSDPNAVVEIFTSKLSSWVYESEWRILMENGHGRSVWFGKISRVYVGRVYPKTTADSNCPQSLRAYYHRRECLIAKAEQMEIPVSEAWIKGGKVKFIALSRPVRKV